MPSPSCCARARPYAQQKALDSYLAKPKTGNVLRRPDPTTPATLDRTAPSPINASTVTFSPPPSTSPTRAQAYAEVDRILHRSHSTPRQDAPPASVTRPDTAPRHEPVVMSRSTPAASVPRPATASSTLHFSTSKSVYTESDSRRQSTGTTSATAAATDARHLDDASLVREMEALLAQSRSGRSPSPLDALSSEGEVRRLRSNLEALMVRFVALQQESAAARAKVAVQDSTIERLVAGSRKDQVSCRVMSRGAHERARLGVCDVFVSMACVCTREAPPPRLILQRHTLDEQNFVLFASPSVPGVVGSPATPE